MKNPSSEELLSAYLDGELNAQEILEAEQLLENDLELRELFGEFSEFSAAIAHLPAASAPDHLRSSVMAAISEMNTLHNLEQLPRIENAANSAFSEIPQSSSSSVDDISGAGNHVSETAPVVSEQGQGHWKRILVSSYRSFRAPAACLALLLLVFGLLFAPNRDSNSAFTNVVLSEKSSSGVNAEILTSPHLEFAAPPSGALAITAPVESEQHSAPLASNFHFGGMSNDIPKADSPSIAVSPVAAEKTPSAEMSTTLSSSEMASRARGTPLGSPSLNSYSVNLKAVNSNEIASDAPAKSLPLPFSEDFPEAPQIELSDTDFSQKLVDTGLVTSAEAYELIHPDPSAVMVAVPIVIVLDVPNPQSAIEHLNTIYHRSEAVADVLDAPYLIPLYTNVQNRPLATIAVSIDSNEANLLLNQVSANSAMIYTPQHETLTRLTQLKRNQVFDLLERDLQENQPEDHMEVANSHLHETRPTEPSVQSSPSENLPLASRDDHIPGDAFARPTEIAREVQSNRGVVFNSPTQFRFSRLDVINRAPPMTDGELKRHQILISMTNTVMPPSPQSRSAGTFSRSTPAPRMQRRTQPLDLFESALEQQFHSSGEMAGASSMGDLSFTESRQTHPTDSSVDLGAGKRAVPDETPSQLTLPQFPQLMRSFHNATKGQSHIDWNGLSSTKSDAFETPYQAFIVLRQFDDQSPTGQEASQPELSPTSPTGASD